MTHNLIPILNSCHGSVAWTMEELIAPASKLISYRILDTKDELIVVGHSPAKRVHSAWTMSIDSQFLFCRLGLPKSGPLFEASELSTLSMH